MKAFLATMVVAMFAAITPTSAFAEGGPSVEVSMDADHLVVSINFDGTITLVVNGTNVPTKLSRFVPLFVEPSPQPDNCLLGSDLAAREGWGLEANQLASVTTFGGAIVRMPQGATVPTDWVIQTDRFIGNDGRFAATIYPPGGACRDRLGVGR